MIFENLAGLSHTNDHKLLVKKISHENYCKRMKYTWLPMVHKIAKRWGKDLVPYDIRFAVNDVELNLQMPLTKWPERKRIEDDGSVTIVEEW